MRIEGEVGLGCGLDECVVLSEMVRKYFIEHCAHFSKVADALSRLLTSLRSHYYANLQIEPGVTPTLRCSQTPAHACVYPLP